MQRLSAVGGLATFLLVGGFFLVLYFASGTESLLAPGFDLSWRAVDSGHVERHVLTRKTSKFRLYERPAVIMLPGETLEVEYAFEGDPGERLLRVRVPAAHQELTVERDRRMLRIQGQWRSSRPDE